MLGDDKHRTYDPLDYEDRILWDAVRRTLVPMHEAGEVAEEVYRREFSKAMETTATIALPHDQPTNAPVHASHIPAIHPFDRPTHRKISKGRIHIDARVDLHGLIQSQAHSLLLHFLQSAQHRGLRHVLVITGKGSSLGSEGVLRQAVPHWLSTAPFRHFVSAFEDAARHHGGQGALYIRLRRMTGGVKP